MIQLPEELAHELEELAADEQRSPEAVLRTMFAQYRKQKPAETPVTNGARETAKAKLLAAGALVTEFIVPEDAVRLTVEERLKIGTLASGASSTLDLINEDRGER